MEAVKSKPDGKKETAREKVTDFVENHPNAAPAVMYGIGYLVAIPLGIWSCRIMGRAQGKGFAEGLKEVRSKIG